MNEEKGGSGGRAKPKKDGKMANAHYPQDLHEEILTKIIPRLRESGERKTIQAIVSEGVEMVVEKYRKKLEKADRPIRKK